MTTPLHADLIRLGDDLERAVGASRRRRLRTRAAVTAAVIGGIVAVGGAATAAVSLLTEQTVAQGLPGGAQIFQSTDPTCTTTDHVVFDCTLARSPMGYDVAVAHGLDDYFEGSKELFVDDQNAIAGGCIAQDGAGLHWTCYAGQRAVDEHIISAQLLGEHLNGPSGG